MDGCSRLTIEPSYEKVNEPCSVPLTSIPSPLERLKEPSSLRMSRPALESTTRLNPSTRVLASGELAVKSHSALS